MTENHAYDMIMVRCGAVCMLLLYHRKHISATMKSGARIQFQVKTALEGSWILPLDWTRSTGRFLSTVPYDDDMGWDRTVQYNTKTVQITTLSYDTVVTSAVYQTGLYSTVQY
jgi:hypothetical protein